MILVLSTPNDRDTTLVVEWLNFKKASFFILNDEDLMNGTTSIYYDSDHEICFYNSFAKVKLNDIKVVWFRKFGFLTDLEIKIGKNSDLMNYLTNEFRGLSSYIIDALVDKKWLFDRKKVVSKIEMLDKAKESGIKIPSTIICSNKSDLERFFITNNKMLITKSVSDARFIMQGDIGFTFHTHKIDSLNTLNAFFGPSLFQEYLEKTIEIRTFFLDNNCYSMAIFSQSNERTKLDFRDYDTDNPNRFVPYKLPEKLEKKICSFMKSINLNTGSLDLIKSSRDDDYYFLEVNPCGQFGMTSSPCNYGLHEKVAKYLINKSEI